MNLEQLVYEAKKGSHAAKQVLLNRLSGICLSLCIRYVKNEADAEERVQDGFYNFFKILPRFSFESDAALYACLKRIMMNECLIQLRKKQGFKIMAEPSETDAMLDEDLLDKLSTKEIHEMICRLPAGARTIFNLFAIDGFSQKEIAVSLGITIGTCKSQLARARSLLQKELSFLNKDHETEQSK